eukprot:IDg14592t1
MFPKAPCPERWVPPPGTRGIRDTARPVPHDAADDCIPAIRDTAYGCLRFLDMFVKTECTTSVRIGAVNTAGIDVEPAGSPVSALMQGSLFSRSWRREEAMRRDAVAISLVSVNSRTTISSIRYTVLTRGLGAGPVPITCKLPTLPLSASQSRRVSAMYGFASGAGSTSFLNRRAHELHRCGRRQTLRQSQQCDTCARPVVACVPPVIANNSQNELSSLSSSDDFVIAPEQDYVNIVRTNTDEPEESSTDDQAPLDLLELDSAGRKALDVGSYNSVVDVNITAGGLLNIVDGDNNELFTGVGMDALLENEQLLANLKSEFSITTATHVQLAAIPRLQAGEDLVMQGHTGTGKTLAFLLPLLESIDPDFPNVQAVVIAPTRELAMQISNECTRLCAGTGILTMPLIGGANPARQVDKLRRRMPHVLIGTPGRLAELEEARVLSLRKLAPS